MLFEAQSAESARIIALALTPVFLLTGLGAILNTLTGRAARLSDRARALDTDNGIPPAERATLTRMFVRVELIYAAIAFTLFAAMMAALIVLLLFANIFVAIDLGIAIKICFMIVATALVVALLLFFAEIALAAAGIRRRRRALAVSAD